LLDFRIFLVFAPIVLALGWALYNIGRAALGQIQLAIRSYKQNTSN
jgi:photosystem II PsbY protein